MRRCLTGLLLVTLAACGGDKSTGPGAAIAGSYRLQTVDGKSLPALIFEDALEREEMVSGNLDVRTNGTWSIDLLEQVTQKSNNSVTNLALTATGSYTGSGSSVTFTAPGIGTLAGTVSGQTLSLSGTILGTPTSLVFAKQ